jgi:hypothetical protein
MDEVQLKERAASRQWETPLEVTAPSQLRSVLYALTSYLNRTVKGYVKEFCREQVYVYRHSINQARELKIPLTVFESIQARGPSSFARLPTRDKDAFPSINARLVKIIMPLLQRVSMTFTRRFSLKNPNFSERTMEIMI